MRHAQVPTWSRPGIAWLALAGVLAAGGLAVGGASVLGGAAAVAPSGALALDWQPDLALVQPWRWWTGALVHGSAAHLALNLAGTLLVALLGMAAQVPARLALAWLLAWPLTQGGWLLGPSLAHFHGLSGVLHAGVAIVGLHLLWPRRGTRVLPGLLLLAGLTVKLALEQPFGPVLRAAPELGIAIAPWSHFSGTVAGLLCAALVAAAAATAQRVGND
ncbi:MAG: rhombosortase [Rubrivivax sp. SCN 71-131]|jgi:rhomboid family GlyGly-CTERM serine protease|nr:MAG: rhombosortase [Rubrivivax sp. SCN 71-131]